MGSNLSGNKSRPLLFVPFVAKAQSPVATTTTATNAKTQPVHGLTRAPVAKVYTQYPTAHNLKQNFNPLPCNIVSPIDTYQLSKELSHYPHKDFTEYLLHSFTYGFRIGYVGQEFSNIANNLKSAELYKRVIEDSIIEELMRGRVAGPFAKPPFENFRTSPIGVVPKKETGKFRVITDLSSPRGFSINDGILDAEASVEFNNFDSAVNIVADPGKGSLMAKLDIKSAFRICPVHPDDWHLLGFSLDDLFFVDLCLPFGLRSSVNRFTTLADTLLWIMKNNLNIKSCTNYLDDYFLAGEAKSEECQNHMIATSQLFARLGVPLAKEKTEGPTTQIKFLGIEIDSMRMSLRLPDDKLGDISNLIQTWLGKKKCTKRELLSLIGKLSFASKVIPSGRLFLRRLIDLSTTVEKLSHHISMSREAREDIKWWAEYLPSWNGRYRILEPKTTLAPDLEIYTDASSLGLGIFYNGKWVSAKWPTEFQAYSIQWKELFPIYITCLLWSSDFRGKRLLFHCDNLAIVNIWSSKSSKCPKLMSLLRRLFFLTAKHEFTVNVKHIPGVNNRLADHLSRLQLAQFFRLAPGAAQAHTQIPPAAWQI